MPDKTLTYIQLAQDTARQITSNYRSWTAYLSTASRLYKYQYSDQLLIHAQRPDATACAEYESAALKMPANLENTAVGTGLEKVSFHSNLKEGQC